MKKEVFLFEYLHAPSSTKSSQNNRQVVIHNPKNYMYITYGFSPKIALKLVNNLLTILVLERFFSRMVIDTIFYLHSSYFYVQRQTCLQRPWPPLGPKKEAVVDKWSLSNWNLQIVVVIGRRGHNSKVVVSTS